MPVKTVLVSLNDISRHDVIIPLSVNLAAQHEAHLIGLYVVPAPQIISTVSMHAPPIIVTATKEHFEEHAVEAEKTFLEAAAKQGVSAEWRRVDAETPDIAGPVLEHGRQAGVIITSQHDDETADGVESGFDERLILESGRPVLFVPCQGEFEAVGDKVVVGWNASREASRAVFDAVPVLQKSSETRLVWVDPQTERHVAGDVPGAEMAAALSRLGVQAVAEALPTGGTGAGDALQQRAADLGADLVVMGGYGHSRMREYILGGATREMLKGMTVPVLMSH